MSHTDDQVLRFTVNERVQHLALMVCAILLVITGLSLRYADTGFGRAVIELEGGIEARGYLHRLAAAGLMLVWAYHVLYIMFTERGHAQFMAILPCRADCRDLALTLRHSLGTAAEPAAAEHFDFRQKFQYWAVGLAVASMVFTGLVMWFATAAMAVMPKWVMDLAVVIHSGEALLIFLVLFVWHLYDTHLRPGVFPMDRTWITGRLSREELRQRHPREHARLFGGGEGQP
ncbi:MAG: cytochrome b/b6 domain-containing protein [Gemmatimonadota bacterium]